MKTKKPKHFCKFTKTCRTLDLLYPPHLKYSKIRRKFREMLLVSEENGRKSYNPQGTTGYIYQKERQLTQFFFMIHPYSKFCEIWETIAVWEFFISFLLRLYIVSQWTAVTNSCWYQIPALIADLFETTDVWLRLNIGYMDREMQEVVLESRKVRLHNLKKISFYSDVIASFPFEFIVFLCRTGENPNALEGFDFFIFFKITKVYSITRYLMHLSKIYNLSEISFRIVWVSFFNIVFSHWVTCVLQIIVTYDASLVRVFGLSVPENNGILRHIRLFYVVVCIFFAHQGIEIDFQTENVSDKLFYTILTLLLNLNRAFFFALFLQLVAFTRSPKVLYNEMVQEVQKFLAQENLPRRIHRRAIKYLEFRFGQTYFDEDKILQTLSPLLRREVSKFLCLKLVLHPNSIFFSVPEELATDLCERMKLEYFLPGDTIYRVGSKSAHIFFLYSGSVAVYSPYGKEIMHWYEGQQFGTSAFLERALHPVTVVALEMTELYLLKFEDFKITFRDEPELAAMVNTAAMERLNRVTDLFFKELKDAIF